MRRRQFIGSLGTGLLAGCSSDDQSPESRTTTSTQTSTSTRTPTQIPTSTATPTASATPEPPDNPWGEKNIEVVIRNAISDTNYSPDVRAALSFWEKNAAKYSDYSAVQFSLVDDAQDADAIVQFTGEMIVCATEGDDSVVGCAKTPPPHGNYDGSITVYVKEGYSKEYTERILKHEFGHTLGVPHGVDGLEWMEATIPLPPEQRLTHDTHLPWRTLELEVGIDASNFVPDARDRFRREIRHAMQFYNGGGDGTVPDELDLREVENLDSADIVIGTTTTDEYQLGSRITNREYRDLNNDGRNDVYDRFEFEIRDAINEEAYAWHAGYWMGVAFGIEHPSYLQRSADASTRQSDWWE